MIHVISQSTGQSVRRICQSLQVPRSSYYHAATPTESQRGDAELGAAISTIFGHHRRRYGYRRIWKQLAADGLVCAPDRVRRLMQEQGLRAIQPKTYVPQTSDGRADLPSPNLLLHQPLPALPNQVWAGDITFIPSGEKWLYLAVVIDLCSRRIVGWALADHLRSDLVVAAMQQAIVSRRHINGLIFHSDRGSQYGSSAFRQVLQRGRDAPKHVRTRQSLSQRLDRVVHGHPQSRDAAKRSLPQRHRRSHRDLRVHRLLLQHPAPPLVPQIPNTQPLRGRYRPRKLNLFWSNYPWHLRKHLAVHTDFSSRK